ncbi:MAG: WG repeat-containing protein [bacterium]|nr:WG repeat-containing protein [bacterium]
MTKTLTRIVLLTLMASIALSCKTTEKPAATLPAKPSPAPTSQTIQTQDKSLFPIINESSRWGFMDETGQVVVEPRYAFVDVFTEGLARVKRDEMWGYVDVNGKEVVEPKYERARRFADGLAAVRVDRKYGYIDRSGTMVIPPQYSKTAQAFSHGLAAVPDSTKKYGFVDRTGKLIIAHRFNEVHAFSEGLAGVAENDKWGFIDTTGNWVLGPQFVWADKFADGYALAHRHAAACGLRSD